MTPYRDAIAALRQRKGRAVLGTTGISGLLSRERGDV
jgi:hypothetical protein